MRIHILTVGRKHESWVEPGIARFLARLRGPFESNMELVAHSGKSGQEAALEESGKILRRIKPGDFVILLDERGKNLSSPELSSLITNNLSKQIIFVIGGAYGVDKNLASRADVAWSLSKLVFPHQLARLILAEQLYRAQEISRGSQYHHP